MKRANDRDHAGSRSRAVTLFVGIVAAMLVVAGESSDRAAGPTAAAAFGAQLTPGSGSQTTLTGRATFYGPFRLKRQAGERDVEVKARNAVDIAVHTIKFRPVVVRTSLPRNKRDVALNARVPAAEWLA